MAIAAAAPALIERVDPNWAIDNVVPHAARISSVSPGPSWPKTSTHASGSRAVSIGTEPGRLSTPTSGRLFGGAQAANSVDRVVVAQVLVAIGHHRAAAVPALAPDDVDLGGEESVRRPHDRADVEVVLPVLDRDVERVAPQIEVGDDRFELPVAVAVGHVAPVAVLEQLLVVLRIGRPIALPWPDADHETLGRLVSHGRQPMRCVRRSGVCRAGHSRAVRFG